MGGEPYTWRRVSTVRRQAVGNLPPKGGTAPTAEPTDAMKRDIIIIEDKAVSVTGNDVWMTAGEIAGLFHTGVPAVNAAIKAILKADVLSDYEVCRYIQLENGLYADVYSLEIIIPVAFRLNTYCTHVFRTWLVGKALSKEKRQAYVMFIQNGKAGYC